ncbi:MAG: hypothetical protein ACI85O_003683 [Saprospiraceae bacterium]|jgi:uncharacterized protein with ParB-like and HNH nuclease domain
MIANQLPINNFLQAPNVQFVIPIYQRNYDWTTNECKQLINDIISVEKEDRGTHFIGSIVFIHEGAFIVSEVKELVIIDGQQRLTTINILYVALYRYAKENNLKETEMIYNMFLVNQYVENELSKLKLKQTDTNSRAFKAIMNGTENQFETYSNVTENFRYFKNFITEDNFQYILNGLKRLIFVQISLDRGKDDPQRIFESLNSTGLDLSQSDLIRNFILMDLAPKQQNKIFESIWNPIEENARDLVKQKSLVSEYIRHYLTLKTKKIPNKGKVYLEFKKLYGDKSDDAFHQELENIKALSVHYKKFVNPDTVSDTAIKKELKYIARLEINVVYPFLLQVFEDAENKVIDKDTLLQILRLIQSYTWRRFVVGLPTSALNKIFMSLYSEVDVEDYYDSIALALVKKKGSGRFPSDSDVKTALKDKDLYNINAKNRNYMFELLENHNSKEYVDTANENITIEHIFPQTPSDEWKNTLPTEEIFTFNEKLVNTIANLTLSGNNSALSNKSFSEKKVMNVNGGEQGYKYSRLWLNRYLSEIEEWNIEKYDERLELINERFLSIWSYPSVEIPSDESAVEQNIFDAEKPTHKKLEYFLFENTKVEQSAISQMYFYVIGKLFEKNAPLLLNSNSIIKITKEANDFRTPQELINGYFIEANIDSNSKFKIIKRLLVLYELEEELMIKYAPSEATDNKSRFTIRKNYWKQLLPHLSETALFNNVSPSKDHWLSTGAGISGLSYTLLITRSYSGIELTISRASKEENKGYFKQLFNQKNQIEKDFGGVLSWEELEDKKMSRVVVKLEDVSLYEQKYWETMNDFFIKNLPNFEIAFQPHINRFKNKF